ncbi:hypothetical protein B0A68_07085 [Flavobacterium reichenbachii]|nr:hypothetical protein B0A68_07085 [Flavobacterium reichenbachii]
MISLYSTYIYQSVQPEIEIKKLISGIVRFFLTIGLLYLIYIGKNWARILIIILFTIANIIALISLFTIEAPVINKTPIIVMIFIYTISTHHFTLSKSFKAFFEYQKTKTQIKPSVCKPE